MLDAEKNKERSLADLLHDYSKQKSAICADLKSGKSHNFDFSCVKAHHSLLLSRVLVEKFSGSKREIRVYQKVFFVSFVLNPLYGFFFPLFFMLLVREIWNPART